MNFYYIKIWCICSLFLNWKVNIKIKRWCFICYTYELLENYYWSEKITFLAKYGKGHFGVCLQVPRVLESKDRESTFGMVIIAFTNFIIKMGFIHDGIHLKIAHNYEATWFHHDLWWLRWWKQQILFKYSLLKKLLI